MKLGTFTQQPGERESYTINYADSLYDDDYIIDVTLKGVAPLGLVVDQITILDDTRVVPALLKVRARYFVTGGIAGTTYKITLKATSADGRVFEDEVTFKIKEF